MDTKQTSKGKNTKFINPYELKPKKVRMYHFKDARLYDSDINESGWKVQRHFAKMKYTQWLKQVRKNKGWEFFRRYGTVIEDVPEPSMQNTIIRPVIKKFTDKNKSQKFVAESKIPGVKMDDVDFRPKMFTEKMGRQLAQKRNELGLTQAELGKKINVTANMIRNIELGGLISYNPADVLVKNLIKTLELGSLEYNE